MSTDAHFHVKASLSNEMKKKYFEIEIWKKKGFFSVMNGNDDGCSEMQGTLRLYNSLKVESSISDNVCEK